MKHYIIGSKEKVVCNQAGIDDICLNCEHSSEHNFDVVECVKPCYLAFQMGLEQSCVEKTELI